MEESHLQIEELMEKIERYRKAVEGLQSSKESESQQIENRLHALEQRFLAWEQRQTALTDRTESAAPFQGDRHGGEQTGEQRQHDRPNVPTFKVLKQAASEIPVFQTTFPALPHHDSPFNKIRNKNNQFKAVPLTDTLPNSPPITEKFSDPSRQPTDQPETGPLPNGSENGQSQDRKTAETVDTEIGNQSKRAANFWNGIFKR